MTVNIKYCGGCNPRYNRGAFAERIRTHYPEFCYHTNAKGEFDVLIVLYGCATACADLSMCYGVFENILIVDESQWDQLCRKLNKLKKY